MHTSISINRYHAKSSREWEEKKEKTNTCHQTEDHPTERTRIMGTNTVGQFGTGEGVWGGGGGGGGIGTMQTEDHPTERTRIMEPRTAGEMGLERGGGGVWGWWHHANWRSSNRKNKNHGNKNSGRISGGGGGGGGGGRGAMEERLVAPPNWRSPSRNNKDHGTKNSGRNGGGWGHQANRPSPNRRNKDHGKNSWRTGVVGGGGIRMRGGGWGSCMPLKFKTEPLTACSTHFSIHF